MKVIFLQDVANMARAGEIKEVADGYGRNFLIPQKLALLASPAVVSTMETQLKGQARNQAQTEAEALELARQLEGREVSLKVRVGAKERLYGAITSADIAAELASTAGITIDKKRLELAEPIHQLGSYEVAIRLTKGVIPKIRVVVTAEESA